MRPHTTKSREFLSKYRLHGAGLSVDDFCKMQGYHPVTYRRWRLDIEGFATQFDACREAHERDHKTSYEREMTGFGLSENESAFLRHYRECGQKMMALGMVGWDGNKLKSAMRSPLFRGEMEAIQHELLLRVEDELLQRARKGSLGHARLVLETLNPEKYGKRATRADAKPSGLSVASLGRRDQHWAERFGRSAVTAPLAQEEEAEEVEDDDGERVAVH